jgi:hypothetical protein
MLPTLVPLVRAPGGNPETGHFSAAEFPCSRFRYAARMMSR